MTRKDLKIEWVRDLPESSVDLAQRRTRDMMAFYGRNITSMPIESMAASCYLQGVSDCVDYLDRQSLPGDLGAVPPLAPSGQDEKMPTAAPDNNGLPTNI